LNRDLSSITKNDVDKWFAEMVATGKVSSTRNAYKLLSSTFNEAISKGDLLGTNPCTIKNISKASTGIVRYQPTLEQVRSVAAVIEPIYSFQTIFMGLSGVRISEAAGLQRRDFRLAKGKSGEYYEVSVTRQVTYFARSFHVTPPKSAAGVRTVSLPPQFTEEVGDHLQTVGKSPESLVFPDPNGQYLRQDIFGRRLKKAVKTVGLEGMNFTPHSLRHAGATAVSQSGASLKEVQTYLGDSSTAAALRYMDGVSRQAELAERIFVPVAPKTEIGTAQTE